MTNIRKKEPGKGPAKAKKLTFKKETIKDLSPKGQGVRGGGQTIGCRSGSCDGAYGYRCDPGYTASDRRIKTDIRRVANALETIEHVRPVVFRYTSEYRHAHPSIEDGEYYNVIAQEFREIFPNAVKGSGEKLADGSEILEVDIHPAMIHAIAAIQELHAQVKNLAQENATLRTQFAVFAERLSKIKNARIARNVRGVVTA